MLLYHGTTAKALDAILRDGIKPRGDKDGNWGHTIKSSKEHVYLTNAYAIYFAGSATSKEDGAVIEIDTERLNFINFGPDEDYLEQATRNKAGELLAPIDGSMKVRTSFYRKRINKFGYHYHNSLERLGTCTHFGTIPPEAITRVATFDQSAYLDMVLGLGIDPMISMINYGLLGAKYRNSLKWLFGDEEEPDPFGDQSKSLWPEEHRAQYDRMRVELKERVKITQLRKITA